MCQASGHSSLALAFPCDFPCSNDGYFKGIAHCPRNVLLKGKAWCLQNPEMLRKGRGRLSIMIIALRSGFCSKQADVHTNWPKPTKIMARKSGGDNFCFQINFPVCYQVPGKPKINKTLVSEMENRLAKRRNKVDQEAYVSEGPDPVLPPPEPVCLPPSGARKPSVASVDSGRGGSVESTSRNSLEPGGYARVSVDQERKEELMLAKAVRRSSAKMLGRDASPNSFTSPIESPPTVKQDVSPSSSLPPPSPVVMRYWKQCSSTTDSGFFDEEGMEHEEPARGVF